MQSAPSGWQPLAQAGFEVDLSYPAVTPHGHPVERAEQRIADDRGDRERVHLTSRGTAELYIEVMRFHGLAPQDEYRQHRPYLEQRFGAGSVTKLTEATLAGRSAHAYSFRWDEGERSVLLLGVHGDTYRVLYDPRSELNGRVVATVTVSH